MVIFSPTSIAFAGDLDFVRNRGVSARRELTVITLRMILWRRVKQRFPPQAGGFFSAEDADSLPSQTDTHKKEGAFCVWEEKEITGLLHDERITTKSGENVPVSYLFLKHYGVENEGNVKPHQVKPVAPVLVKPVRSVWVKPESCYLYVKDVQVIKKS